MSRRELTEAEMLAVQAATQSAAKRFFTRSMRSSGTDREDIASEGKYKALRYLMSRETLPDDLADRLVTVAKSRTLDAIDEQNRRRYRLWRKAYSLDAPRGGEADAADEDETDEGNILSSGPEERDEENAHLDLAAELAAYRATLADDRLAVYTAFENDVRTHLTPRGRIRRVQAALGDMSERRFKAVRAALREDLAPLYRKAFFRGDEKFRPSSWSLPV